MSRWYLFLVVLFMLASCGSEDYAGGDLNLTFARRAIEGPCPEEPATAPQPPDLDLLEVSLYRPDGKKHFSKSIDLSGDDAPTITGIPTGDDLTLAGVQVHSAHDGGQGDARVGVECGVFGGDGGLLQIVGDVGQGDTGARSRARVKDFV